MASSIHDFLKLFASVESIYEDAKNLKSTIIGQTLEMPITKDFVNTLSFLSSRDILRVSVIIGDNDSIDFISNQNNPDDFINRCNNLIDINYASNTFRIELNIVKQVINNRLSVYSLNDFFRYLNELKLQGLLYVLNEFFRNGSGIIFESQYEEIILKTPSFGFCSPSYNFTFKELSELRTERINANKSNGHYNLLTSFCFIPDDFQIIESSSVQFSQLFERLLCFFSISFLFDIITVNEFEISYKLNGYKTLSSKTIFKKLSTSDSQEYFKIYEWCYNGGNLSDKIGLARNIISLHLANNETLGLSGNPFSSIQSSYKVYEKQNIKQYIEIRNKISDQLLDFRNKADKIIENFAGDFKKSLFAFITFFSSIIVIQVLKNGDFLNTFTTDATVLAITFLSISFCFFLASRWELNKQKERFSQSYNNLKIRYKDLLNDDDIERILNNDKDHQDDLEFINGKKKVYSILWITAISVFFIAILFLFSINTLLKLIHLVN